MSVQKTLSLVNVADVGSAFGPDIFLSKYIVFGSNICAARHANA